MKLMATTYSLSRRADRLHDQGPHTKQLLAFFAAFILAGFLSALTVGVVMAQTNPRSGGKSGQEASERIELSVGKSLMIDLPRDVKDVLVANPKIANAVVRSARHIFIVGIADGATSVYAMDADGKQIAGYDITVGRDLNILRQTLHNAMPGAQVTVEAAGDSVLLVGSVASASEASQASDIANAFVGGDAAGGGAAGSGKVINALTIRGKDQVMIKVSISEVQRTILKQLGVNSDGSWDIGRTVIAGAVENPFVAGVAATDNIAGIQTGSGNTLVLRAMEKAGVMRTLAEPTLTAISGETASFLVGGEVPILTGYSCQGNTGPCTNTLEFKKFGVSLTFTPIVMSEGRMSLRIATEVSEVDPENSYRMSGATIPGFRVRRSETTVELPSGGTLVTAGLIQQKGQQAISGLPGFKNIPILGALFRSREYQRQETEMMISVTPYIARPVSPGAVSRPDDGFIEASDPQASLLGRFNKIYGSTRVGAKPKGTGPAKVRSNPGFIND